VWLLLPRDAVPDRWRDRVKSLPLLPLLPAEAEDLLGGRTALPGLGTEDEQLLGMLARVSRSRRLRARSTGRREALSAVSRTCESDWMSGSTAELALLAARRGL
jgi:hypothetical protein